jgi:molybdopterin converting factor small subunit
MFSVVRMNVKVKLFYPELQRRIGDLAEITVTGNTVGECLHDLEEQYPGAEKLIFDDQGQLLKPLFVFVNTESMYKAELNKKVTDNDVLIIAMLMLGG